MASVVQLFDRVIDSTAAAPLSQLLPLTLTLARQMGDAELTTWARLELEGYFSGNPAMTEETDVPEYRTVAGVHWDQFGRMLVLPDADLDFVNRARLRQGIGELERFSQRPNGIEIRNPDVIGLLRQHLRVELKSFQFNAVSVHGVLDAIRTRLIDQLEDRRAAIEALRQPRMVPDSSRRPKILQIMKEHATQIVIGVVTIVIGGFLLWKLGWL